MEKDGFGEETESCENENELEKELNELKNLFQQELDKAAKGEDDEADEFELIQPCEDLSDEDENDQDEALQQELPLCECCEEKPCSIEHGEDYPYCDDCRRLMIRYPVRFSGVLTLILTIVLFVAGIALTGNEILDAATVTDASTAYSSGHLTSAYTAYSQYFSNHYSKYISKRAVRETIDTCMSLGAVGNVISVVEENFTEDELNKASLKDIKKAYDMCKQIDATTSAVYQSIVYPATLGYTSIKDAVKELEKFSAEIDKQGEESQYNKIVTEYYIYSLLVNGDYDEEIRYNKIKEIAEIAGEDYEWLYTSALAMAAAESGDLDIVTECAEIIKENNRDDILAYTAPAHYYAKQKKIDAKKLLEICAEADAAFPSGSEKSHYRYYAMAYLLDGEEEKALEKMQSYVENGLQYYTDANLYALCGLANGNEDICKEVEETLAGYGGKYKLSEQLTKYKKGKITIEKIFETYGGDFI